LPKLEMAIAVTGSIGTSASATNAGRVRWLNGETEAFLEVGFMSLGPETSVDRSLRIGGAVAQRFELKVQQSGMRGETRWQPEGRAG
jgi:hypothetical protein